MKEETQASLWCFPSTQPQLQGVCLFPEHPRQFPASEP